MTSRPYKRLLLRPSGPSPDAAPQTVEPLKRSGISLDTAPQIVEVYVTMFDIHSTYYDSWKELSVLHLNCFRLPSESCGAKLTDESAEIVSERGVELTHFFRL